MHYFTITKINDPRLTKHLKEKEIKESKGPLPLSCRYLEYVFCFRIKEKEKHTFYIKFYFIIFLQSFFIFPSHYFNKIIIIDMCVQFIIVTFYYIPLTILRKIPILTILAQRLSQTTKNPRLYLYFSQFTKIRTLYCFSYNTKEDHT